LAGFRVAWVLRCSLGIRDVASGERLSIQITERADGPATDLINQLNQPSDPPDPNVMCTAELVTSPYFALVGPDGRAVKPNIPNSGCGFRPGVLKALAALPFRTIATAPLRAIPQSWPTR
jgi:hypothetical protein